jgi:hypothetical protein
MGEPVRKQWRGLINAVLSTGPAGTASAAPPGPCAANLPAGLIESRLNHYIASAAASSLAMASFSLASS